MMIVYHKTNVAADMLLSVLRAFHAQGGVPKRANATGAVLLTLTLSGAMTSPQKAK